MHPNNLDDSTADLIKESRIAGDEVMALPHFPRGKATPLGHLVADHMVRMQAEIARLREFFTVVEHLNDHPGYPGFVNHADLQEIVNDYRENS